MNAYSKLAIIGTVGVPAKYGGFETLAHQLVLHLRNRFQLTVYASQKNYPKEERSPEWEGAKVVYLPLKANGLQSILYDMLSMLHALLFADVMLVLGVSGCLLLPFIKLFPWVKVIVNVDGLEWRRAKWNGLAKKFLIISEKIAVRFADEIITDNAAIQKYVHENYGIASRLIEYGADHAQPVGITEKYLQKYPFLKGKYAFKVCRIEPENNIHVVLEAFAKYDQLPLVIVGNWEHSEYGHSLRNAYKDHGHLHLLDPIFEPEELNTLRSNCTLYVHGHSAGGTNPSLVEAMYLGRPILAFDVLYNRITTQQKALYFSNAGDICRVLAKLDKYDLEALASTMKSIANRMYLWSRIARLYAEAATSKKRLPTPVFDFELPKNLQRAS